MKLKLTDEQKKDLRQAFRDGFIYQPFTHACGYRGNSYLKINGAWRKLTHCPQCKQELKTITLEEALTPSLKGASHEAS